MDRYQSEHSVQLWLPECTEQTADNGQSKPATGAEARVGVPQIMKTNSFQTSPSRDRAPRAVQVRSRLSWIIPGHYVGADFFQPIQHCYGRSIQDYGFSTAFAVGQKQQPALQINVFPL